MRFGVSRLLLLLLWDVLLPLSWPAVAAVALFGVAVVFNDFLYTFTLVDVEQVAPHLGHQRHVLMSRHMPEPRVRARSAYPGFA